MNTLTIARFSALALAAVIPLSTSLTNISGIVIALCCLIAFNYRSFYNAVGVSILILVMWYGFRALYSVGEMREVEHALHKMGRLLIIPPLALLCADPKWRRNIIMGFVVAVIISVIAALNSATVVFKDNIITSLFVAYSTFILAHFCMDYPRWKWIMVPFAMLLSYYLLFVSMGRSGQVILLMLSVLFCIQRFGKNWRLQAIAAVVIAGTLAASIILPSSFAQRHAIAVQELQSYSVQNEEAVPHTSSIGVRMILVHNTWELIKQKPLLGWGTGGYRQAYSLHAPEAQFKKEERTNPHNQYMAAWVETGIFGLLALIGFFTALLITFWRQKNTEGQLGVGLVLAYIAGCVINSWLLDCAPAHFFVLFTAVFLAGKIEPSAR